MDHTTTGMNHAPYYYGSSGDEGGMGGVDEFSSGVGYAQHPYAIQSTSELLPFNLLASCPIPAVASWMPRLVILKRHPLYLLP